MCCNRPMTASVCNINMILKFQCGSQHLLKHSHIPLDDYDEPSSEPSVFSIALSLSFVMSSMIQFSFLYFCIDHSLHPSFRSTKDKHKSDVTAVSN